MMSGGCGGRGSGGTPIFFSRAVFAGYERGEAGADARICAVTLRLAQAPKFKVKRRVSAA